MKKKLQLIAVTTLFVCSDLLPFFNLMAQEPGGVGKLRVQVLDADWEAPLAGASVTVVELDKKGKSGDDGSVLFDEVPFGKYNVMITSSGFERQLMREVVINPGEVQQVVIRLSPIYTDMDELVVRDFDISAGSDTALIELKMDSTASFDAVSADTISRAGASDAASALKLVSGATVQDGKYAVVRGLPDRYVNSQINGVRVPTADPDKRAVQLDQFPSAMIESIRVTKTFMPDQQGDATGGAIDIRLKRMPDKFVAKASFGWEYNDNLTGNKILSGKDGGVPYWGDDGGDHARPFRVSQYESPKSLPSPGIWKRWDFYSKYGFVTGEQSEYLDSWSKSAEQTSMFSDAIGTRWKEARLGQNWKATLGDSYSLAEDVRVGYLGTISHKYDVSGYNDGVLNKYKVVEKLCDDGSPYTEYVRGGKELSDPATYSVDKGTETVLWAGALTTGFESPWLNLGVTYLRSQAAEYTAVQATDDSQYDSGGNIYRNHSLYYAERMTETTLFQVEHPWFYVPEDMDISGGHDWFVFNQPVTDFSLSRNKASQYEPDRRIFNEVYSNGYWQAPDKASPLERRWRDIKEDGWQYAFNQKIPFRIWSDDEGYFKGGYFQDNVERKYTQDTFTYASGNDGSSNFQGCPSDNWGSNFNTGYDELGDESSLPVRSWYVQRVDDDIDYRGKQDIQAWYWMADVPVCSFLSFQGGIRVEQTEISTKMKPSKGDYTGNMMVLDLSQRDTGEYVVEKQKVTTDEDLNEYAPELHRNDRLPALGTTINPVENLNLRLNWSETVARPTFKELMPVPFRPSVTDDIFFGNPYLEMSEIDNYDARIEYMPSAGQLFSVSYFYKDIDKPIDLRSFSELGNETDRYITPVNYPEGEISGWEFEIRQDMGAWWRYAKGLTLGFNSTLMDSEVVRPKDEYEQVKEFGGNKTRRMAGQPDYILGTYAMYDIEDWGTSMGLFFNRRGDVLAVGDSVDGDNYTPSIYEEPLEQLDFTFSQKFLKHWTLGFKIKNLLDPQVKRMYRMDDGKEALRSSYRKGREYSIALSCEW